MKTSPRTHRRKLKIEPIPRRRRNYFAEVYTRAEIHEDNRMAKASVIRVPKDME